MGGAICGGAMGGGMLAMVMWREALRDSVDGGVPDLLLITGAECPGAWPKTAV